MPQLNTSPVLPPGWIPKRPVLDGFSNVMAGTGLGSASMMQGSMYSITRMTRDYWTLTGMYRCSWIVRRVCGIIPADFLQPWLRWDGDLAPDEISLIEKTVAKTKIKARLLEGFKLGNLYGGALGLMLIDGQEDLAEPLDLEGVMAGDFKGLHVAERWAGVVPTVDQLVSDLSDPDFGLPKYYSFPISVSNNVKVHHSRVIRFLGDDLPTYERRSEQYWGASKVEAMYREVNRIDNIGENVAGLTFLATMRVQGKKNLNQSIGGTEQEIYRDMLGTLQAQSLAQSNFGTLLLDADDTFQTFNSKFEGLDDVRMSFMLDICGASGIPLSRLFGRTGGGLSSSSEGDMQSYYDMLRQERESRLTPIMDKLRPVLIRSTYGEDIPDLAYVFEDIQTPDPKDNNAITTEKVNSLLAVFDRGVISEQVLLKELQAAGTPSAMFTNITDKDISAASDKAEPQGELDPGAKEGDFDAVTPEKS